MVYGTIILSAANLIVRLLGFAYRVFLSKMIGPQGLGLVQLTYPVFNIAITLTITGIPVAVSRLISEQNIKSDIEGMRRTMAVSIALVGILSACIAILSLFNLDFISRSIVKDERTKGALFVLFPCSILISLSATLKGFFYGYKKIHPPALAGIIEQIMRMAVSIGLICWLMPGDDFALAAVLVMSGTIFGETASLLLLHKNYVQTVKKLGYNEKLQLTIKSIKASISSLLAIALPITVMKLLNSLMSAANSVLIPQRLMAGGLSQGEAVAMLGVFSGMVMPLLFLPFTITNALTVIIIPNLSESRVMNRWKDIQNKIYKAVKLTCYIAFPATALLASIGKPIADLLYQNSMAGTLLIPLSYILPVFALQHTSSGILNGLGKQKKAAIYSMAGSFIQLLCTWFLAANPKILVWSMAIGFTLSSLIVCSANIITLLKTAKMTFRLTDWLVRPGIASMLMGFSTGMVYNILSSSLVSLLPRIIISAGSGLLAFIIGLILLQHLF